MELGFLVALVVALGVCWVETTIAVAATGLPSVVAQRHLALGVGLEERRRAGMAVRRHALQDLVAVGQGRRHQLGGLVAGETEHDALVAGAFVLVAGGVDALGDVADWPWRWFSKLAVCQWKPACS